MNLWGKKAKPAPTLGESIQQLREANEILEKREQHLQKQMATALAEAKKKSKAKDKRGALFHLKRKKMYEKQIDQIYGKKTNIEIQIMTLEAAAGNTEVLAAMRKGADALKRTVKDTDVDKVADVMDDINESMALADELGEAMSQSIGPAIDEDELNAELEEMENELTDQEMLKAVDVPAHRVQAPAQPVQEKEPEVKAPARPVVAAAAEAPAPAPAVAAKPTPAPKVLVMAGGAPAPAKKAAPPAAKPAAAAHGDDDAEARELRELEAQMGMQG